jgi:diaminohydroxyphosphoribosylaminopyrimidine deaminase/5-amino-6-(5-phosphoribosylamino)uracil reductase
MTTWSAIDLVHMKRAIELAAKAEGLVAPNPLVGCVIVAENGKTIGEGWHQRYGEAHAEVNAHRSLKPQDIHLLPQSTWYVTLEPCNHQGKTPACAALIESIKPMRLVIGSLDSNPAVDGGGLHRLSQAGIIIESGCLENDVRWQNRRFFCNAEKQRAHVVLKWAQSRDGYMDPRLPQERRAGSGGFAITGEDANPITHEWRAHEMGILIGVGTALIDEPALNVRYGDGTSPQVIVIDPNNRLPTSHSMLQREGANAIIRVTRTNNGAQSKECLWSPEEGLKILLQKLWTEHGISSILVEGGARTLQQFLKQDLWDELKVWTASHNLNNGLRAPKWPEKATAPKQVISCGTVNTDRWDWAIHPTLG